MGCGTASWIASMAVAIGTTACSADAGKVPAAGGQRPAVVVEAAEAARRADMVGIAAVGTLRAQQEATLRFATSGPIERIQFKDGQLVRAGDVLVLVDAAKEEAEFREAVARRNHLRSVASRANAMADRQLLARSDAEQAGADFETSEAKVSTARAALQRTRIVAPFSGAIGLRVIDIGDYASVGQTAVQLVDARVMNVDFRVPESRLRDIRTGQTIELSVDTYPEDSFRGEIIAISPQVDVSGRSIEVRARVPNPAGKLRSGQLARVRIDAGEPAGSLALPESAIWSVGGAAAVFRVDNGIARSTQVKTGNRRNGFVEIIEGLSPGDQVVVAGQQKISDGAPITVGMAAAGGNASTSAN